MPLPTDALQITSRPSKIYREHSRLGQALNFDFIVENSTDETWAITVIEVSVLAASGQLIARKEINESGSIQTIPNRELTAHSSALVFNPFFLFDHQLEFQTLRYKFTLTSATTEQTATLETVLTPETYQPQVSLRLPVKQRAIIWDGHDFYSHHRRFNYLHPMLQSMGFQANFQRYGYDFVPVNEHGEMVHGETENNANWFGFGATVVAPAGGRVADLFEGMPDDRQFDPQEVARREMTLFGNYVVLDHDHGEYSCLAHLKQGSVQVQLGQTVQPGQPLGQIGASGSSLFPHLHYELRNGLGAKTVEGLPSYFHGFRRVVGAKPIEVEVGPIDTGDILDVA